MAIRKLTFFVTRPRKSLRNQKLEVYMDDRAMSELNVIGRIYENTYNERPSATLIVRRALYDLSEYLQDHVGDDDGVLDNANTERALLRRLTGRRA